MYKALVAGQNTHTELSVATNTAPGMSFRLSHPPYEMGNQSLGLSIELDVLFKTIPPTPTVHRSPTLPTGGML